MQISKDDRFISSWRQGYRSYLLVNLHAIVGLVDRVRGRRARAHLVGAAVGRSAYDRALKILRGQVLGPVHDSIFQHRPLPHLLVRKYVSPAQRGRETRL